MILVEIFLRYLQQPDVRAEALALVIARVADPTLDFAAQLARIDLLAALTAERLASSCDGRQAAERFLAIFTEELAFHGDRDDYYDPRNSLIDVVLDRRAGLPIMLCLLCMAIGQRLGLQIDGLGFPNHFMARYQDRHGAWLLDPFHSAVVEVDEAEVYLESIIGRSVHLTPDAYEPVTPRDMALRILNNLRAAYLMRTEMDKLLDVLALQATLAPDNPQVWRDRAVLHFRAEAWEEAARDLRRYFFLLGALPHLFPDDVQAVFDLPALDSDDRNLLAMHRRITDVLNRLN